jgi:hypothetical protein
MNEPVIRVVECRGCGTRQPLVVDRPGYMVQLPLNWKRIGVRRDGSWIVYCGDCYRAELAKAGER